VISANAVQIAPVNLAAMLATTSIASAGIGTFTLLNIMTVAKLKFGISALIVAGVTIVFVVQQRAQEKLRAENESLAQQIAQLQTDNEILSNRLAAAGDSKSLTDEQFNELLKLRGEVGRLRHQQNNLPETVQSEMNRLPDAEIIQIHLKTRFVSLPTDDLQALGIGGASGAQGDITGLLAEQQFKPIIEALQGASDVEHISEPEVLVSNGRPTEMRATQSVPVGGTNAEVGASFDVIPYFSTNSSTFNLILGAKLTQLTGDPSQPGVQTIQATNQVTISPGQTFFLEEPIPSGSWLPDATNISAGPRSLLVFVTPTVVDTRGNPINFPPPNQ
jgi:cell division protein FtsB